MSMPPASNTLVTWTFSALWLNIGFVQVVTDAANRYNAAVAAQQPQEAQYATDAQYAEAAQ